MKKICYSPDSVEKLQMIKEVVSEKFGEETAQETILEMMEAIDLLVEDPELGDSVSDIYNVPTEYRRFYTCHNNVFYYRSEDNIFIVDIYHEREDFIAGLFGNAKA